MTKTLAAFFAAVGLAWLAALPALADDPPAGQTSRALGSDPATIDLQSLLNTKVITASKFSEDIAGAPGVMSVVTRDELRRFGGITLREILERVPGLAPSTASFTDRSIVAARGDQTQINGGHILFLINGRPTREVLEGGIINDLLEAFPVSILERIEVIKGPGSVLYGSHAFSAVVNLITQKAEGDELTLTGQGGPSGAAETSGSLFLKHGNLSIAGAAQFHQYPTWFTPVSTTFFGVENAAIPNRGKGGYLELDYKRLSLMSSFSDWTSDYIEGGVGVARWRRGFADLGYRIKQGGRWEMTADVTYTRTTLDAKSGIPFITRDSYEALAEWTNVVTLSDRDKLTFGALYDHVQGGEYFYAVSPAERISHGDAESGASYAQIDHQLFDNLKLIAGLQANNFENVGLKVIPRGGVVWTVAPRWTLKALYSQAYRAPSLNETLLHYVPPADIGGPSLLGNLNLLPERVATIDAELNYQRNRFQASAGYFHSVQTDRIVLSNVTSNGTYMNVGRATFDGVEGEGKYYFKKNFLLMASASYRLNVEGSSTPITPIPDLGAKAGISYESSSKGLTVGMFDLYEGPVHGYGAALNPKPNAYSLLSANFLLDLSKYLHAPHPHSIALVAHGENLANTALWLPDWKDVPGDTIFVNRGRSIYVGLEFSLKKD
jgi:outer membrane receptor for ferrienterochelin and colicin